MMSMKTTALYLSPATDLPLGLLCGFGGGPEKVSVLGIFREYVLYFSSCGFGAGAVRDLDKGSGGPWKKSRRRREQLQVPEKTQTSRLPLHTIWLLGMQ